MFRLLYPTRPKIMGVRLIRKKRPRSPIVPWKCSLKISLTVLNGAETSLARSSLSTPRPWRKSSNQKIPLQSRARKNLPSSKWSSTDQKPSKNASIKQWEFSLSISGTISVNCYTHIRWTWRQKKESFSGRCQRDLQWKLVNLIQKIKATRHLSLLMQCCSPKYSQSTIQKTSENQKQKLKLWNMQLMWMLETSSQAPKSQNNCKSWMRSKKKANKRLVKETKSFKPNLQPQQLKNKSSLHHKSYKSFNYP